MSIVSSIRLTPTKNLSVGSPQSQAAPQLQQQNLKGNLSSANISLTNVTGIVHSQNGTIQRLTSQSLTDLANNVINNNNFLIPSFKSSKTTIQPSYKAIIKPKNIYRTKSSDNAAADTRKFESYERLSGLSSERPEVILLSEFKPLFSEDIGKAQYSFYDHLVAAGKNLFITDTGNFIDTQINARNLRATNVVGMLSSLRENASFDKTYKFRKSEMANAISELDTTIWFLLSILKSMNVLKGQLDLRDDIHIVIPQDVVSTIGLNFTKAKASWLYNFLQRLSSQYLPQKYDLTDVLIKLGYSTDSVKNIFSSTKIWLQILEEYKDILQGHSLEFLDISPVAQRSDNNATVITKQDSRLFILEQRDPRDLPFLNEIVGFSPTNITNASNIVTRAYSEIYSRGIQFRSEEARIAGLVNIISKEFRFSRGLASPAIRRVLSDQFNFIVNDGPTARSAAQLTPFSRVDNLQLFDFILGQFTNNVTEIPLNNNNSLASISQERPTENIAVLPFESQYLEGRNGTITPGSAWYVDDVLNVKQGSLGQNGRIIDGSSGVVFDTSRLERFADRLHNVGSNFASIVDGLNLYGISEFDTTSKDSQSIASILGNQSLFLEKLISLFIDNKGDTLPIIRDDRLTAIFTIAHKNPLLKSQLFLFYINRIARSYAADEKRSVIAPITGDNTPFTDEIVKRIMNTIFVSTKISPATTIADSNDLTDAVLENSLKKGTKLSNQIEVLLKEILEKFNQDNAISIASDRTRFSGHMDTTIMMVVFDMIIAIISQYGNQVISGRGSSGTSSSVRSGKTTTYFVTQNNTNYRAAISDLLNRTKKEQALIQQITWALINSMTKLNNSIVGFVNHLNTENTVSRLRAISSVIDNNEQFKQLMSEHQIMMLGSHVYDIAGRFQSLSAQNSSFGGDLDQNNTFNSDDTIAVIDDSIISPRARDILFGFFSMSEFTGRKAINKKILTVGLPLGFSRKLNQKVKIDQQKRNSFKQKQNDIIEISVYKIDLLNQDIVFKPQKFLFELSRFSVRNDNYFGQIATPVTMEQVMEIVPTRDFEESFEEGTSSISYFRRNANTNNTFNAMDSDTYDFISEEQKSELIKNHITSYMCEQYLNLLTGLSTAEYTFKLDQVDDLRSVDDDFVKLITTHKVSELAAVNSSISSTAGRRIDTSISKGNNSSKLESPPTTTAPVLFSSALNVTKTTNPSGVGGTPPKYVGGQAASALNPNISSGIVSSPVQPQQQKSLSELERSTLSLSNSMSKIGFSQTFSAIHALRNISNFTRMQTTISSGLNVSKNILKPKQFDRVFNIMIDPDDFLIDYNKTVKNKFGKEAFNQLISRGVIQPNHLDRFSMLLKTKQKLSQLKTGSAAVRRSAAMIESDIDNFILKERDKSEGDVSFEKYFIVVNTFGEDEI